MELIDTTEPNKATATDTLDMSSADEAAETARQNFSNAIAKCSASQKLLEASKECSVKADEAASTAEEASCKCSVDYSEAEVSLRSANEKLASCRCVTCGDHACS